MEAILISIRAKHCTNIIALIKLLEIRTTAPKDWKKYLSGKTNKKPEPKDVFIYCTEDEREGWCMVGINGEKSFFQPKDKMACYSIHHHYIGNGEIIARIRLNEEEEIKRKGCDIYTDTMFESALLDKSCLDLGTICHYLKHEEWQEKEIVVGYAWHIDEVFVYEKPLKLKDFLVKSHEVKGIGIGGKEKKFTVLKPLTKAPQSWHYVEI